MSIMTTVRRIPYTSPLLSHCLSVIYLIGLGSCYRLRPERKWTSPAGSICFNHGHLFRNLAQYWCRSHRVGDHVGNRLFDVSKLVVPPLTSVQANSTNFVRMVDTILVVTLVGTFFIITLTILINGLAQISFFAKTINH